MTPAAAILLVVGGLSFAAVTPGSLSAPVLAVCGVLLLAWAYVDYRKGRKP